VSSYFKGESKRTYHTPVIKLKNLVRNGYWQFNDGAVQADFVSVQRQASDLSKLSPPRTPDGERNRAPPAVVPNTM